MNKLEKVCSKCNISKPLESFYIQKTGYLGRRACCKKCLKDNQKEWTIKNENYQKEYKNINKSKINKIALNYYYNNKTYYLDKGKTYYKNNKDILNEKSKIYYKNNKDKAKEYNKNWREKNPEKWKSYSRNRYKKNLELATIKWMRNFLYRTEKQGFKKSNINTLTEFGYTPKQLIQRIEVQFKIGMSWSNRKEWHIDHKKPISSFKEDTSPKIINMLSNLQPLWSKENLSKGYKF